MEVTDALALAPDSSELLLAYSVARTLTIVDLDNPPVSATA